MPTFTQMAFVLLGGGIGSIFRYLSISVISFYVPSIRYPVGTLTVNVVGCFAMGVVAGLSRRLSLSEDARLFLATGLLGGFTTFSAFGLEIIQLLRGEEPTAAALYITASVVLGCVALVGGLWLSA